MFAACGSSTQYTGVNGIMLCRAEHVINSETEDIPKRVKEITGKLPTFPPKPPF